MNDEKDAFAMAEEFADLLRKAEIPDSMIPTNLSRIAKQYIEERIYMANTHAQLGMHVEAIMKHFKGLQ